MKVIDGESGPALDAGVAKFLSADESSQVIAALEAQPGDMVFLVADERRLVRHVLGLLRLELGKPPVNEGGLNFLWVVDFPLFETIADNGSRSRRTTRSRCRTRTTGICSMVRARTC